MGKKPSERVNGKNGAKKPRYQPRFKNWRDFDPSKVVGDQTLVEELTTYRDNLDELLKRKGDYVLIKGRQVIGVFADFQEAIEKAYDHFGGQPALVKQIVARERIHTLGGVIL
jgi:hypothetical protein